MREIKFRAWNGKQILNVVRIHLDADGAIWWSNDFKQLKIYNAEHNPMMQYTGLKDKNGKETYHKDICVGSWPYAKKCTVEWDANRCGFYLKPVEGDGLLGKAAYDPYYKMNANKFEVIGNIYETPELLKVKMGKDATK